MELRGARVLVVGLGKSGVASARLLVAQGARVIAADLRDEASLGAVAVELRALGVELQLGPHDPALFSAADRIVLSPGVGMNDALVAADRAGVPVISEIELAAWFLRGTIVAITGTNGKSTVTSLVGEMCAATGRPTFVGGNLGTPLVDAIGTKAAEPGGIVVAEVSSFQLERVARFRAHVAVLLNVTPDHLDRHGSLAAYAAAKGRVFHGQRPDDAAIVPAHDPICMPLARAGVGRVLSFGTGGDVEVREGVIVDHGSTLRLPVAELGLRGGHNVDNAMAAALAARMVGVGVAEITSVLRGFRGLPHRMAHVRDLDGVAYYDDSKATNVGAAVAALEGLEGQVSRVVLIAGGKDKGGSYAPLEAKLARLGRAAVLIGEAAPVIREALGKSSIPVVEASSMQEAVERARSLAQPGDAVLLAPACASFDMFQSYAHRGDVFQEAVRGLGAGGR